MTTIDSKPSSDSSKSEEGSVVVHTALISRTSTHTSEVPDSENKGDL